MEYAAKLSDWFVGGLESDKNEGLHAHFVMNGVKMPGGKPGIDRGFASLFHRRQDRHSVEGAHRPNRRRRGDRGAQSGLRDERSLASPFRRSEVPAPD